MRWLLGVLLALLGLLLWRTISSPTSAMDWADLVSVVNSDGRTIASAEKIGFLIGLAIGGWVVIVYAYAGKLTYDILMVYLVYTGGVKVLTTYLRVLSDRTAGPTK